MVTSPTLIGVSNMSKTKKNRVRPRIGFRFAPTEYKFVVDMARLVGQDVSSFAHAGIMRQANAVYKRAQELAKQEQEARTVPTTEEPMRSEATNAETDASAVVSGEAAGESTGSNLVADAPAANG